MDTDLTRSLHFGPGISLLPVSYHVWAYNTIIYYTQVCGIYAYILIAALLCFVFWELLVNYFSFIENWLLTCVLTDDINYNCFLSRRTLTHVYIICTQYELLGYTYTYIRLSEVHACTYLHYRYTFMQAHSCEMVIKLTEIPQHFYAL